MPAQLVRSPRFSSTVTLQFSGISICNRKVLQCQNAFSIGQAIIYVVDSSDTERIGTSAAEFHAILDEEELKDALILVYANKQVLPFLLTEMLLIESATTLNDVCP